MAIHRQDHGVGRRIAWRRLRAFSLLALALAAPVAAQDYQVQTYSEVDGLPSSAVYDACQDRLGRMWFATRSGLAVYDGVSWRTFSSQELGGSVSFRAVRVGPGGVVWALADRPRPALVVEVGGGWRSLPLPEAAAVLATSLAVGDVGGRTMAAVGTAGNGVLLWDGERWRTAAMAPGSPAARVRSVEAVGGVFYAATEAGLAVVSPSAGAAPPDVKMVLSTSEVLAVKAETGVADAAAGPRIWLLTAAGVGTWDGVGLHLLWSEPIVRRDERALIEPDGQGGVYFGSNSGLFHVAAGGGPPVHFDARNGLIANGVSGLFLDREGILWITCLRGVSKLVSRRFANYRTEHGLLEDEVSAIAEPAAGRLVFGHNLGLTFYDGGRFRRRPFGAGLLSGGSRVLDLFADGGELWIAGSSLGLGKVDSAGRGRIVWHGESDGLPGAVTGVLRDRQGTLWVATDEGLFTARGSSFVPVHPELFAAAACRRLVLGRDATLYVATAGRGVLVQQGGVWTETASEDVPGANNVYTVYPGRQGRTWVGTAAGLFLLEGARIVRPAAAELAVSRPVYLLFEDREGSLWIGTDHGIGRWSGGELRQFTVRSGLAGWETNRAAGLVDHSGRVWIGTDRGVSVYQPALDRRPRVAPLVTISGVETSRRHAPLDGRLTLAPSERDVSFPLIITSFLDERALSFRSYLEGFDAGWLGVEPYHGQPLRYTHLPPGRYVLHVQARGQDGPWSPVVSSPEVVLPAPLWRRGWFLLLEAAVVAGLLYGVLQAVFQRRYAARLEGEVASRTRQLEESRRRYRTLFDQSPDAVVVLDAETTLPLDFNDEMLRLTGYGRSELEALPLAAYATSADAPDFAAYLRGLGEAAERQFETCLTTARGELRNVLVNARHLVIGERPAYHTVIHDITEHKRLEERLREVEKLQAVGQVTGSMAHEFNNLLAVVQGNLDLLQGTLESEKDLRRSASAMAAVRRAADLMAQLLSYARRRTLQPRRLDLNAHLAAHLDELRARLGPGVRLETRLEPGPCSVRVDPEVLETAILHLVANAADAMADGGTLRLETSLVRRDEGGGEGAPAGSYVLLTVRDSGPGIAPAVLERVFEPFFTTKPPGEAVGLGLSMVYGFAHQSAGWVEIDSEPERGTAVRLYLPFSRELEARDGGAEGASPPAVSAAREGV